MNDLEECIAAAHRINDRTSSLAEKKKAFEKDVLAKLGDFTARLVRWTSSQPALGPKTTSLAGEGRGRSLGASMSMGAIPTLSSLSAESVGSHQGAQTYEQGLRSVRQAVVPVGSNEAQSTIVEAETVEGGGATTQVKLEVAVEESCSETSDPPAVDEVPGSRKRPYDLLESPSPPPRPASSLPTPKTANRSHTIATPIIRTPSTPAPLQTASSGNSSLQRRKSTRPLKTPQRFASVHTWSSPPPRPIRAESSAASGSKRSRRRSSSSIADLYTAGGEYRQRRRLRDVRKRPDNVMATSDGRPRVLGAVWPKKKENTVRGIAQVVVCDSCDGGAHFACAGIDDDADMIDEEWICPDCQHLRKTGANTKLWPCVGRCIRPTCVLRAKQAIVHKQDDYLEFVVDRIIGQRPDPMVLGNMEYLISWDGWEIQDSTWEPQENLRDIFLAKQKDFHSACRQVGVPIRPDSKEFVMLPIAAEYFGPDGKLLPNIKGWSRYVESEEESRSSSIIPL